MYRFLLVFLAVGWCEGAILAREETRGEQDLQTDETKKALSTTPQNGNKLQPYSGQGSQLPSSQYYYPTYPEYSSGYPGKNGYEGYLIPAAFSPQRDSSWISDMASLLLPFSSQLLVYGFRAGTHLLHFLFILVLGTAFTMTICTFTPVCTINVLGFGINKNQVKEQVAELARTYITPENINTATLLVTKAVDKYAAMQREKYQGANQQDDKFRDNNSTA